MILLNRSVYGFAIQHTSFSKDTFASPLAPKKVNPHVLTRVVWCEYVFHIRYSGPTTFDMWI